jgi:hypothetical protein
MYQSTHLTDASIEGATGAVLFSANMGVAWQTLTNFANPVIWVEMDPVNPNRLFAAVISTDQSRAGIYVSANIQNGAAASWQHLASPPRTHGHPFNIHALRDGSLLCTYSGRRAGNPQEFTASSGVFLSTNGGSSWLDRSDPRMVYWTMDVVIDPSDAAQDTWYAGVYSGWGGPPNNLGGLYATTNRGVTWTRLSNDGGGGVSSCTFNPLNANQLYVTTETEGLLFCANIHTASPALSQVLNYPFAQPERVFFNPYNPSEIWVTSFGNGIRVGVTAASAGTLQIAPPQGGVARITVSQAPPGAAYSILESTNLIDWTLLGSEIAGPNGMLQFTDTAATNAARFYKGQASSPTP